MKIYKTINGTIVEKDNKYFQIEMDWDSVLNDDNIYEKLSTCLIHEKPLSDFKSILKAEVLPPIGNQEIWASGVTYYRSREARMEESKDAGGGDFYDRVYEAARPELFFKSPSYRAIGHKGKVRIRMDSNWNVPEPELTLVITSNKKIIGYTIGNDMSSRDIEGENPLYLPQAKTYDGSTAIGPCIYLSDTPLKADSKIGIGISRMGINIFQGETIIGQMKREPDELVDYLFRELTFKDGVFLMTGTGVVPPDSFTLVHGDIIRITIDNIGTLINEVE